MNLLFLDTETTGNMPGRDRLCSIAYKIDGTLHHEMFKPPVPISIDAMATHHITNEMVDDKEAFQGSSTYKELEQLLQDHILVAHNAPFDMLVLEAEGLSVPRFICTLRVARHIDEEGKIPRFSLQYLRYLLKLNVEGAMAHDAAGDVLVLEALFDRLQVKRTVEEMLEISKQPSLLRTINFGKYRGQKIQDIARTDRRYLEWLLSQKEQDSFKNPNAFNDEDLIHSLKHYLSHA